MTLAVVRSRAIDGLDAPAVLVEVHLANGLPSFTLVGLADTEVKEARERVRAALQNSGLGFPNNKRITVNLAPADLPKESGRFDLPIALGILAASRADRRRARSTASSSPASSRWPANCARCAARCAWRWRCAAKAPARALVLPAASAREAALVDGRRRAMRRTTCSTWCAALLPGDAAGRPLPRAVPARRGRRRRRCPTCATCSGQAGAKRALEIAAAGGHSVLMVGPPGTGKSMLAQRLAGLLPPLTRRRGARIAPRCQPGRRIRPRRAGGSAPLRAPHHSARRWHWSAAARRRGPARSRWPTTACCSSTSCPSSPRAALEALREPLETGRITISRAARQAEFPARFQLVAAMNPCPCGHLGARAIARLPLHARRGGALPGQLSRAAARPHRRAGRGAGRRPRRALAAARRRSQRRDGARAWQRPRAGAAAAPGRAPTPRWPATRWTAHCALDDAASTFLQRAAVRLGWSARGFHRVLRMARSIADLAASDDR